MANTAVDLTWREVEPDFRPSRLSDLRLDCGTLLHLVSNWLCGIRLYLTRACLEAVCMHVGSSSEEVGGLLVGRALEVRPSAAPIVLLEAALESLEYRNSAVRVEMGVEVWSRTHGAFDEGRCVVGWYHSHPGLGAFFSATDRKTQQAFFRQPYSIGWVIDPERVQHALFLGMDSAEYPFPPVVLEHALGSIQPVCETIDHGSTEGQRVEVQVRGRSEPVDVRVLAAS